MMITRFTILVMQQNNHHKTQPSSTNDRVTLSSAIGTGLEQGFKHRCRSANTDVTAHAPKLSWGSPITPKRGYNQFYPSSNSTDDELGLATNAKHRLRETNSIESTSKTI
jgi:hypothetical protein